MMQGVLENRLFPICSGIPDVRVTLHIIVTPIVTDRAITSNDGFIALVVSFLDSLIRGCIEVSRLVLV